MVGRGDPVSVVGTRDAAVQHPVSRVFFWEMLALRGDHHVWMLTRVQLAVVEDSLRIPEDVVNMSLDETFVEELS